MENKTSVRYRDQCFYRLLLQLLHLFFISSTLLYANCEIQHMHYKLLFSGVRGQVSNTKNEPLPKGSVTSISTSISTIHSHEQPVKLFKSAWFSRILPVGNFELKALAPGISSISFKLCELGNCIFFLVVSVFAPRFIF